VSEQCVQRILGAASGQKPGGPPSLDTAAVSNLRKLFETLLIYSILGDLVSCRVHSQFIQVH